MALDGVGGKRLAGLGWAGAGQAGLPQGQARMDFGCGPMPQRKRWFPCILGGGWRRAAKAKAKASLDHI